MKINYRQTCILIFLSQIALKFLALPSLLYTKSESNSIFVALALMIIDGVYAFLILNLAELSGEKNIYEFMKACLGAVVSKIFLALLLIKFALSMANISKGLEFFVVDNLYSEFSWFAYILPLAALIGYMIYKGVRNIARVGEIVCWFVLVGIIFITAKSFAGAEADSFLPLFKNGFKPLATSAFTYSSWFGSSTFLLLLFGKVDFKNKKKSQLIRYLLLAILLVQFVYYVFFGVFQITSPTHNFCLSDLSQFSSLHTSIEELSWLVVALWIVAQAVQLALYGYCFQQCVKYIFNIKNNIFPTLVVMVYVFVLSLVGDLTIGLEQIFLSQAVSVISLCVQYIIPLVIFVAGKIKFKNTQNGGKSGRQGGQKEDDELAQEQNLVTQQTFAQDQQGGQTDECGGNGSKGGKQHAEGGKNSAQKGAT